MTDVISVGPGAVATQVVAKGDGETLVINTGPGTVYFGDNNAIRALDGNGIVPITPNSYFGVTGEQDLYACVLTGQTAQLNVISGGLNFFLPLTSLTIPYGAGNGQRIVINPPAFPGSIVGYNPAGLIEFIISPNGYLIYDATGGALNHLFIALQNQAGSDTFTNPFAKGIQVGPQTGPQVLIAGGNPATISFPENDSAFDAIKGRIFTGVGTGVARYAALTIEGPTTVLAPHDDYVELTLNSPNADGSSSANLQLYYVDINGVIRNYFIQDYTGVTVQACGDLRATTPGTGTSVANPAQSEAWNNVTPPAGWSGVCRYKRLAESKFGLVDFNLTHAGATGNIIVMTLPALYRPINNSVQVMAITSNTVPANDNKRLTIQTNGQVVTYSLPNPTTTIASTLIYPID